MSQPMVIQPNQPKPPKPEQGAGGPLMVPRTRRMFQKKHGGAWKVAYADFVTALMALFIVLWITNSTPRVNTDHGKHGLFGLHLPLSARSARTVNNLTDGHPCETKPI